MAAAVDKLRGSGANELPVEQQRAGIEAALGGLAEPLFVFIDDIDRLTSAEIRDMLGLVRLTAHFPKVIYLLAFDRMRVEQALDEHDNGSGRGYLDKIVELSFGLPAVSEASRVHMLADRLGAVSGIETVPFDPSRWEEVLGGVFEQIAAQLRLKGHAGQELADRLLSYGQAPAPLTFVPLAGVWLRQAT